ncbi:MAG: gamma-glutamyltransferase family protein [Proteobacteria bacterium]|nr:gamma-glutamyltransferase family protein [Pseudomonadota bacterium]
MTHGMVSAAQPEAVEAGLETLQAGGNAVDAAVATALVQTAVDPQMCGIAGFGCMHVYSPKTGVHVCLDFYGRAPMAARPDMWADLMISESEDGFGFILKGNANCFYGSIATPMTLRALGTALKRFGTMQIGALLGLAVPHCENGFVVRPHVSAYWNMLPTESKPPHSALLTNVPATRKIYVKPDGKLHAVGDTLRNRDLGATYRRIATVGIEAFYEGEIARRIAGDMRANGALLAETDLAQCRVEETKPLWGSYRGHRIATNPPPGGGLMLLEMLNILEYFDLKAMGHNTPDYIATVAEAMKLGAVDRDMHLGDPKFVDVPVARLSSKEHAARLAERVKRGEKAHVPRIKAKEAADTTQVCVVDEHGTCVSLTHTLGSPSGVVTDGLGFMYNGAMEAFDPRPGHAASLAPGKARVSSMAPTIVFKGEQPFFVVGAPGGTYITPGILQAVLNVVEFDMTALEAISAPRFCATSDTIHLTNRILRSTERDLATRGYPVKRIPLNFYFAGVHGIRIDGGRLDGAADPGRDGMAAMV